MGTLSRLWGRIRGLYKKVEVDGRSFYIRALHLGALHELTAAGHLEHLRQYLANGVKDVETKAEDNLKAIEALMHVIAAAMDRDIEWVKTHVSITSGWALLAHVYHVSGFIKSSNSPQP
jgi:hypothetical protein